MQAEDTKRLNWIKIHYKKAMEKNRIFKFIVGVLVICIVFDNCSKEYCCPLLENIFHRNPNEYSELLTFILAVWAATLSIIVIGISKIEESHYGIKLIHILYEKDTFPNLIKFLIVFVLQLFVIFLACIVPWEITMTVLCVMQILIFLFVFLLIYVETSRESIKEGILNAAIKSIEEDAEENAKGKKYRFCLNDLMIKVIKGTDFKDNGEVNYLFGIYNGIITRIKKRDRKILEKYIENSMDFFFEVCTDADVVKRIILNVLSRTKEFSVIRGTVTSVMKNMYKPHVPDVREIFKYNIQFRKKMLYWGIAYNLYYSVFEGQECRENIAQYLRAELDVNIDKRERLTILINWERVGRNNYEEHDGGESMSRLLEMLK